MKNKDVKIVKVYEQANGEKIAISMLKTAAGMVSYFQPSTDISRHGTIEGEVASAWGKLPVVLVSWLEFKALKKQYEVVEYAAPVYCHHEREKKTRPDAAALKLYKAFATDEANPQRDEDGNFIKITVDNYTFYSGEGAWMLKELKRNFNFTKADIAAALALNIDEPQQQPEPAPAPVEDIEAAVVAHFEDLAANAPADDPAADILRASIETGKVIICSVPKAEPTTPASEKTEPTPTNQKTAADDFIETGAYPIWYNTELECTSGNGVDFKVVSWGRKQVKVEYTDGQRRIFKVRDFINSVEKGYIIVSAPYDCEYMAMLKHKQEQPAALTDADVLAAAARIKSNCDTMKQQAAADTFADAITAYCASLEQPAASVWSPEVIILKEQPADPAVDAAPAPRHRRRLNIAPRLSRWLHPARWVAAAFVVCLLSGLLLGMNTSTAAADDIAAVYELHPVTVTADAPDTFIEGEAPCLIEDKAPCLIEDKAPAPSPVKKLAAPSPVKNMADAAECSSQKTDTADTPAGEKTASPTYTASDPHGLTICEGTPWAYTMMNWA